MQQNRIRDYVIFENLPRLHWDYIWPTQGLHTIICNSRLAVISYQDTNTILILLH